MSGGPIGRPHRRKTGGRHDDRWARANRVERMIARQRESMCAGCGERPVRPAVDGDYCQPCYDAGAIFG